MDQNATEITRQRINQVKTETQPPQATQQNAEPAETQIGSVTPPIHLPPQVLRKLIGRAPNRAMQSLVGAGGGPVPDQAEQVIQREVGGGQPLQSATQAQMGSALGANLEGVRVHNDATSDQLAGQLGARAFTVGSDVFFAANEYQPATTGGQTVLAHELAHVMQDSDVPQAKLQVGSVDDPAETEADTMAQRVVETIHSSPGVPEESDTVQEVRRQPEEEEEVQMARRQEEQEDEDVQALRRTPEEEEEVLPLRRTPEEEEELQMARRQEEEEEVQMARRQEEPEDEEVQTLRRQLVKR